MKTAKVYLAGVCLGLAVLAGCDQTPLTVPVTRAEYDRGGREDRKRHTAHIIIDVNMIRILNTDLPVADRVESLRLVEQVGVQEPTDLDQLATLLEDPKCPKPLADPLFRLLLRNNYSGLAARITALMPTLGKMDADLQELVQQWLQSHPLPSVLSGLVQAWARPGELTEQEEKGFRQTIQRLTGQPWDQALLDSINTSRGLDTPAQAQAIGILHSRLGEKALRRRIALMTPRTESIRALQYFMKPENHDYLPATSGEYLAANILFSVRRDMLPDAVRLSREWTNNFKYQFHIRDFHLLSRLSRDPLRSNLKRTELVLKIGKALQKRKHVQHRPSRAGAADDYKEDFWLHSERLGMADLWNLYLLNEMLTRPRVRQSVAMIAANDLSDNHSRWGGLVFYQNGQAEMLLYFPNPKGADNDRAYLSGARFNNDGRDAMCRFICHFEKVNNADRAGPNLDELTASQKENYYGLILTRLDETSFCAHYFSPEGIVVSMGKFSLR